MQTRLVTPRPGMTDQTPALLAQMAAGAQGDPNRMRAWRQAAVDLIAANRGRPEYAGLSGMLADFERQESGGAAEVAAEAAEAQKALAQLEHDIEGVQQYVDGGANVGFGGQPWAGRV